MTEVQTLSKGTLRKNSMAFNLQKVWDVERIEEWERLGIEFIERTENAKTPKNHKPQYPKILKTPKP